MAQYTAPHNATISAAAPMSRSPADSRRIDGEIVAGSCGASPWECRRVDMRADTRRSDFGTTFDAKCYNITGLICPGSRPLRLDPLSAFAVKHGVRRQAIRRFLLLRPLHAIPCRTHIDEPIFARDAACPCPPAR